MSSLVEHIREQATKTVSTSRGMAEPFWMTDDPFSKSESVLSAVQQRVVKSLLFCLNNQSED